VDEIGELSFSFKDIMASMQPFYALRLIAGLIFLIGTCFMAFNLFKTLAGKHAVIVKVPPVDPAYAMAKEVTA
jgi:cytochrome c oxidase cbb3-type subunit 1